MGPKTSKHHLLVELTHRIHSPLAAIRNALYLAGCRSEDPEVHAYLAMADSEVNAIVRTLGEAREASAEAVPERDLRGSSEGLGKPAARKAAAGHITGITACGCS